MGDRRKALVVGGSFGGLFAANLLMRAGWDVEIFERVGEALADRGAGIVTHDELFEAVAKGEYKFHDAERGAKSTMTSLLGRMATYSGQMIEWDKAINSGINIMPKVYAFDAEAPVLPDANGLYPVAVPGVTKYF